MSWTTFGLTVWHLNYKNGRNSVTLHTICLPWNTHNINIFSLAIEFLDKSSGQKSCRFIIQNFTFLFCAHNESGLFLYSGGHRYVTDGFRNVFSGHRSGKVEIFASNGYCAARIRRPLDEHLTLEAEVTTPSQNSGKRTPIEGCNIQEERRSYLQNAFDWRNVIRPWIFSWLQLYVEYT